MSRDIGHLSLQTQILYNRHNDRVRRDLWFRQNGVTMIVTCTARSNEEQAALHAQGRTRPGRIVTNAKPGQSAHNAVTPQGEPASEAYDILLLWHGKPMWSMVDLKDTEVNEHEAWQRAGQHGIDAGLKWYGAPDAPFPEGAHFQNPAWRKP